MADRSLRKGTRKDYNAIANGTDWDTDEVESNTELENLSDHDPVGSYTEEVEQVPSSLKQAEERLKSLKLEAANMEREERRRRIEIETQQMEEALEKMKRRKEMVMIGSLRKMGEIVEEADEMMAKQNKKKTKTKKSSQRSQSSESSEISSTDRSTLSESESETDSEEEERRSRKKEGKEKEKEEERKESKKWKK